MAEDTTTELQSCELKDCSMIASDGNNIKLDKLVIEIVLNQSIDAPFITGRMVISDTKDLPSVFSLSGNELIVLSVQMQGREELAIDNLKFRIYRLEKSPSISGSSSTYIIHFCTAIGIENMITRINKSYRNQYVDAIVGDTLSSIGITKKLSAEESIGQYNLVVADWRPIELINWCCSRAFGVNRHAFHFYETVSGFRFESLQNMYASPHDNNTYTYDVKNVDDGEGGNTDKIANRTSFETFNITQDFDVINSIGSGAFSSSLLMVDVKKQKYSLENWNINLAEGNFLNEYPVFDDKDIINSVYSNFSTYITTDDGTDELGNKIKDWFLPSRLHKKLLGTIIIDATLSGDFSMEPGTYIKVDVPEFNIPEDGGKKYSQLSGKYLIRDVVHVISNPGNEGFKAYTNLTLCSDSFSEQLPSNKNISRTAE